METETITVMSVEDYAESYRKHSPEATSETIAKEYALITQSDEIRLRFLEYPLDLQVQIIMRSNRRPDEVKLIGVIAEILHEFYQQDPETYDWSLTSWITAYERIVKSHDGPSTAFAKEIGAIARNSWYAPGNKATDFLLFKMLPVLLSKQYGEEMVLEVCRRWNASPEPLELHKMLYVVRNWENLKNYPIDWAEKVSGPRL